MFADILVPYDGGYVVEPTANLLFEAQEPPSTINERIANSGYKTLIDNGSLLVSKAIQDSDLPKIWEPTPSLMTGGFVPASELAEKEGDFETLISEGKIFQVTMPE